ncbi:hypothetical protein CHLRE_08g359400v5 [Chlamydomonas reinhardtii]|uniref:Uncharacterized protein n=1 Tax=Chlamydomonas reinhardtii TaxID=3055 RepID=A0A2K3DGF1_CHLRE|nr:uncharacterized protein CHLRE_08g359400v5 [Chlamydomonas reinhardtii]PNW79596.1 hypothetical protein CHLRE_08g359400v5 [Chlamydomonas reinhardtii]
MFLVQRANQVASEMGATMAGAAHGGRYYDDDENESDDGQEDAGGWVTLPGRQQQAGQAGDASSGWRWWAWQASGSAAEGDRGAREVMEEATGGSGVVAGGELRPDGLQGMCVACMAAPATVGFLHTPPPPPSPSRSGGSSGSSSAGRGGSSSNAAGACSLLVHNCLCSPCWERLRGQGRGQRCPVCNQRAPSLNVVRT